MLTLEEVKEKLSERYDEHELIHMLGVDTTSIVIRYIDLIEDQLDYFRELLSEDDPVDNSGDQ